MYQLLLCSSVAVFLNTTMYSSDRQSSETSGFRGARRVAVHYKNHGYRKTNYRGSAEQEQPLPIPAVLAAQCLPEREADILSEMGGSR